MSVGGRTSHEPHGDGQREREREKGVNDEKGEDKVDETREDRRERTRG